ncbi:hypothetical protein ENSA7_70630 [Enhygromyxa salina]|uniref:Uncharacterized protein n=1 Tax=Enhygromyxa salina TaxID=215803 RepID=A0A2S9XTQ1_9BACT|nr:hypothetical protein ENSA7_70630 [Enhygromyxa salina]
MVISLSLVGTANASSVKGEGEGERGEFGEHGQESHEDLTEPSRDTESGEYEALEMCDARRARSNLEPHARSRNWFFVPRVIAPTPRAPAISRRLRRISATDDDPDPDSGAI